MDSSGHWHDVDRESRISRALEGIQHGEDRPRFVMEASYGEMVSVVKDNGESIMATFDATDKNKVTLTPQGDGPRPYLELAERVQLQRATGGSVVAQVWDNRAGKIILRTLPVGQ